MQAYQIANMYMVVARKTSPTQFVSIMVSFGFRSYLFGRKINKYSLDFKHFYERYATMFSTGSKKGDAYTQTIHMF